MAKRKAIIWITIDKPNRNDGNETRARCLQIQTENYSQTLLDVFAFELYETAIQAIDQKSVLKAIAHDIRAALEIKAQEIQHAEQSAIQQTWSELERRNRMSGDSRRNWEVPETGVQAAKKPLEGP